MKYLYTTQGIPLTCSVCQKGIVVLDVDGFVCDSCETSFLVVKGDNSGCWLPDPDNETQLRWYSKSVGFTMLTSENSTFLPNERVHLAQQPFFASQQQIDANLVENFTPSEETQLSLQENLIPTPEDKPKPSLDLLEHVEKRKRNPILPTKPTQQLSPTTTNRDREEVSKLSLPVILQSVGGFMLLVAIIALSTFLWGSIPSFMQVSLLVGIVGALGFAGVKSEKLVPSASFVLKVLTLLSSIVVVLAIPNILNLNPFYSAAALFPLVSFTFFMVSKKVVWVPLWWYASTISAPFVGALSVTFIAVGLNESAVFSLGFLPTLLLINLVTMLVLVVLMLHPPQSGKNTGVDKTLPTLVKTVQILVPIFVSETALLLAYRKLEARLGSTFGGTVGDRVTTAVVVLLLSLGTAAFIYITTFHPKLTYVQSNTAHLTGTIRKGTFLAQYTIAALIGAGFANLLFISIENLILAFLIPLTALAVLAVTVFIPQSFHKKFRPPTAENDNGNPDQSNISYSNRWFKVPLPLFKSFTFVTVLWVWGFLNYDDTNWITNTTIGAVITVFLYYQVVKMGTKKLDNHPKEETVPPQQPVTTLAIIRDGVMKININTALFFGYLLGCATILTAESVVEVKMPTLGENTVLTLMSGDIPTFLSQISINLLAVFTFFTVVVFKKVNPAKKVNLPLVGLTFSTPAWFFLCTQIFTNEQISPHLTTLNIIIVSTFSLYAFLAPRRVTEVKNFFYTTHSRITELSYTTLQFDVNRPSAILLTGSLVVIWWAHYVERFNTNLRWEMTLAPIALLATLMIATSQFAPSKNISTWLTAAKIPTYTLLTISTVIALVTPTPASITYNGGNETTNVWNVLSGEVNFWRTITLITLLAILTTVTYRKHYTTSSIAGIGVALLTIKIGFVIWQIVTQSYTNSGELFSFAEQLHNTSMIMLTTGSVALGMFFLTKLFTKNFLTTPHSIYSMGVPLFVFFTLQGATITDALLTNGTFLNTTWFTWFTIYLTLATLSLFVAIKKHLLGFLLPPIVGLVIVLTPLLINTISNMPIWIPLTLFGILLLTAGAKFEAAKTKSSKAVGWVKSLN